MKHATKFQSPIFTFDEISWFTWNVGIVLWELWLKLHKFRVHLLLLLWLLFYSHCKSPNSMCWFSLQLFYSCNKANEKHFNFRSNCAMPLHAINLKIERERERNTKKLLFNRGITNKNLDSKITYAKWFRCGRCETL